MKLLELKDTAFAKYMRSLPRDEALIHFLQCLSSKDKTNNLAFELMDEVNGEDWVLNDETVLRALQALIGDETK